MKLMLLGGPMMWPLLALSLAALAVIVERLLVILPLKPPAGLTALSTPDDAMRAVSGSRELGDFARALERGGESAIVLTGESIVERMSVRLAMLGTIAKTATLLGLLGTILGMISAFAVIAETTTGVDMAMLAQGLWQALITTATGLVIAIPSYLFLAWFESRVTAMSGFLTLAGNIVLAGRGGSGA